MRKIDTWLFIVFFLAVYLGVFLILSFTLMPIGFKLLAKEYLLNGFAFAVSVLACFLSAFGLRSYYELPTSLVRLAGIVVAFQLILNLLSSFWNTPKLTDFLLWVVIATGTWLTVYGSFYLSEKYFSKKHA